MVLGEVDYYLLSHSVELAIKAVAQLKSGLEPEWGHDKVELADRYQDECNFTDSERETITKLRDLNNGPGGLRYDNQPIGSFLPFTFENGTKIIERLLGEFE